MRHHSVEILTQVIVIQDSFNACDKMAFLQGQNQKFVKVITAVKESKHLSLQALCQDCRNVLGSFYQNEHHRTEGLDLLWSLLPLTFSVKPMSGREDLSQNISKCMDIPRFVGRACSVHEAIRFPKKISTEFFLSPEFDLDYQNISQCRLNWTRCLVKVLLKFLNIQDKEVTWHEHDFTIATNFMPIISVTTPKSPQYIKGQNMVIIIHLRDKFN